MSYPAVEPRPHYWREAEQGARAKSERDCPYGVAEIGKRCAWLAGYRDARQAAPGRSSTTRL